MVKCIEPSKPSRNSSGSMRCMCSGLKLKPSSPQLHYSPGKGVVLCNQIIVYSVKESFEQPLTVPRQISNKLISHGKNLVVLS